MYYYYYCYILYYVHYYVTLYDFRRDPGSDCPAVGEIVGAGGKVTRRLTLKFSFERVPKHTSRRLVGSENLKPCTRHYIIIVVVN